MGDVENLEAEREDIAARLDVFARQMMPDWEDVFFENLARTSTGFSRESWIFDVTWRSGTQTGHAEMILRRDPVGSLLNTHRQAEFEVLRALQKTKVPAPAVYWLDDDGRWLGRPGLVMQRVGGRCDWFVLNGSLPVGERRKFGEQFVNLLADIHQVDWRGLGLDAVLGNPGRRAPQAELERWYDEFGKHGAEAAPELTVALKWLLRHMQEPQATVLVHGDFKPGNALLNGNTIAYMLDWETAHLSDPLEDLGWITNPIRAREHQIRGVWEAPDIVAAYAERTGFQVSPATLRWWNVFSCFKSSVIIHTGLKAFLDGEFDRIHQSPSRMYRTMLELIDQ